MEHGKYGRPTHAHGCLPRRPALRRVSRMHAIDAPRCWLSPSEHDVTLDLPLDHLVVLVPDLDAARIGFADSGFTVTPIARHSAKMGTANACIMLRGTYIELLAIVEDTAANEGWRELLSSGPGLKGIALRSGDLDATAAMLERKGVIAEPAREFARPMPQGDLRFSVIRLTRDLAPGLQCIYCRHHTPELLWTDDAMRHANGAVRIVRAAIPGSAALSALATGDAANTPVGDGPEGRITIEMQRPFGDGEAIRRVTGVRLEGIVTA